ncbi:MAG: hypothetical protein DLM53_10505 [Candidatus Eremiobacter antarcticus]|nr:YIP1 family protein [Candidatus Eremiobacteraeota bacterium]MBC5807812.1 YIP1 family protein [Candidatus Eremiobacteraeota bacterium]PZR60784.1 MAG: hypothetical protein DLM53_10505 [Candidatus Eremiobacter sp. RRmetagenome_bin22]
MAVDEREITPAQRSSGLAKALSVIISPKAAFEQLAAMPAWGWAAIIGIALTLGAVLLSLHAQSHLVSVMQDQRIAQMPSEQQAAARTQLAKFASLSSIFIIIGALVGPWLAWLIAAVVFIIAAALGGGTATFGRAWVAAVNCYIVYGIAGLVNAIILSLRDPSTVNSMADVMSLPSLAMIVHPGIKLTAFLFNYNVLYIWYYVVVAIALYIMLKLSRTAAIVTAVLYSLIWALYLYATAK